MLRYVKIVGLLGSLFIGTVFLVTCGGGGGSGSSGGSSSTQSCQNFAAIATTPSLWTQLSPTGTTPVSRRQHAFAYDATNDRLMIHGGRDSSQFFSDLWVLYNASGSSGTPAWSQLTTVGTAPKRYLAASAYNRAKNTFILFGGSDTSGQIKMDLWLLSNANGLGGAATWSTLPIGGTPPSARGSVASAYDETSDTLILFGGGGCSSTACTLNNETWLIRNATTSPAWQKLTPTGTPPSARANLSAVYDPSSNQLIIFGGNTSTANPTDLSAMKNDTWILSNVTGSGTPTWSQVSTSITPPARGGHSAVFDSTNNRMIVFAGVGTDKNVRKDVWILANAGSASPVWAEYLTGTPQPPARVSHAAVYTGTAKNRMSIFGGDTGNSTFTNDAWVLRNANGIPSSPVSAITITGGATSVCNGYTIQLTPVATDAAGNELSGVLFTWVSSDTTVITVSPSGLVTTVGPGTATITASGGGVSGLYTPTVTQPAPSTGGGGNCAASPPCCSTNNGIQTVGVIVKASDCDCPPETTYAGMDNITAGGPWKMCTCNGC